MEIGQVIYEGPSVLDGQPIVAIAAYRSSNTKTGPMIQTWIMRQDLVPTEAIKSGQDSSVCGSCPHRHHLKGSCYVSMLRGPQAVWKAYHNGRYLKATPSSLQFFRGRDIRLGAYGDPAAVPVSAWRPLVEMAGMTTGYTHQINHPNFDPDLLEFCMVSSDSAPQAEQYQRLSLRTFRVKKPTDPLMKGEILCPATVRKHFQCVHCGLCSGATQNGASIAVDVHGTRKKNFDRIAVEVIEDERIA